MTTPDRLSQAWTPSSGGSRAAAASRTALGRPRSVLTGGETENDIHTADGDLLLRSDSTGQTLYYSDAGGSTEIHQATGASSASASRTYLFTGQPVAVRTAAAGSTTSTVSWLISDTHSTTLTSINSATGAVTRRYLDPFGNTRGTPAAWPDDKSFLDDPTTPPPTLNRSAPASTTPPSAGSAPSTPSSKPPTPEALNGYSYADNDPTNQSDPTGLRPSCLDQGSCAGSSNGAGGFTLTYTPPPGNSTPGNCGGSCGTGRRSSTSRASNQPGQKAREAYENNGPRSLQGASRPCSNSDLACRARAQYMYGNNGCRRDCPSSPWVLSYVSGSLSYCEVVCASASIHDGRFSLSVGGLGAGGWGSAGSVTTSPGRKQGTFAGQVCVAGTLGACGTLGGNGSIRISPTCMAAPALSSAKAYSWDGHGT